MNKIFFILCLIFPINIWAQVGHKPFDNLLKLYVSKDGIVNYTALKTKKKDIEGIINEYSKIKTKSLSKNEQLAFYINIYNIHTIYKIVSNLPVSSIKNLDKGKPWDVKNITIDSKKYSLNDIENVIVRPTFKDARVHFAFNCGAMSCPILLNEAYTGEKLIAQLENQTRKFINDKKFNTLATKKLKLSKIFDWYKTDFGNICDFLNKYASIKIDQDATISYLEYDWKLNGK